MTRRPNPIVVATVLIPVGAAAWAALAYCCWAIGTAAANIIDLISRSL